MEAMNQIERYDLRELREMKERCLYMITSFSAGKDCCSGWADIYKIALVEINRELDTRTIKKEVKIGGRTHIEIVG